ncbi:DUF6151 family protein [uncultured Psychrosphaera sp.]|uniref:DUF6151 family protein n=1 Tax=uncultured Psychrosphaera sp. TaxID=1403522 RepID=UPI0026084719|nr:DUF6151 family protein [uncultured Psychrosphaera sp.]
MPEINLKCTCGMVQGKTANIDKMVGNRIVCCCDDCQSFAEYLKQEDSMLDQYGGTDLFQMPISYVKISQGNEQIACVKLREKGMFRWYAKCCNTPIGNSLDSKMPFLGLVHNFMDNAKSRDEDLGSVRGYLQTKYAKKEVVEQNHSPSKATVRMIVKLLVWKIKGLNTPSAFFNNSGEPVTRPTVLSSDQK